MVRLIVGVLIFVGLLLGDNMCTPRYNELTRGVQQVQSMRIVTK